MADFGGARPPRLALRMLTLLSEAAPNRASLDLRALTGADQLSQVVFTTTRERAVVALSMCVLQALSRHGASRVDPALITQILDRLWPTMSHAERVEVEIEAFEMLEFVGRALAPSLATHSPPPEHVSPESSHEQVARWAIHHARDLRIEFYDPSAGKLIAHHITPMSLEASNYLRAISHTSREELVFSLKSAGLLEPLDGWTMHHEESVPPDDYWQEPPDRDQPIFDTTPSQPASRGHMSWLDEVPAPQEEEE